MKNQDAKNRFVSFGGFCDDRSDACNHNCNECSKMEKLIIEALEKADKYRWHDLRKRPDDLPESDYKTCEVWLEGKIIDIAIWHDGVFVPWSVEYFQYCPPEWRKPVIAWKYIEPFEVTE